MSKTYRQVKVNLDPDDYEQIERYASKEGLTIAAFLRKSTGIDMAENRRLPKGQKKKNHTDYDFSLLYHLSKIGTDLSQIAKRCNIEKSVDRHTLFSLEKIYQEIWEVRNDSQF